ncbi:respiratory nitrate reductase subunit gamma [Thioalkalivibrio paradoxus]|uniref:Nitrate reductase n=1 Tax=Thioalkalivibrio paradoxus ARh 1 TaxID=713585 RepID=W0DK82_9GAMM|nr:respiratory nitrate reductase subunit gamma [Thioalkalivibrio paradoxus]AHE98856.1 nitrate reductase [Thioalkalivibrio paradoxus ARh 1]
MFVTVLFALLFYAATAIFLVGIGMRIARYARTPAPLKIPTTPAPTTRGGVVVRMATEVLLFNSLFKANKWIWIFGILFHVALALVLLRHLRYFLDPVPTWVVMIQPFGKYAAFAMVIGLAGLWARRLFVERIRYISSPSDHLMLALLLGIGLTGLAMTYLWHVDITAVKLFFTGLMRFDFNPLPAHPMLLLHLLLVAGLMIIFPFSKLLHAPGVFFSPTRNQVDNPREKRHVTKVTWMVRSEKPAASADQ